MRKAKNTFIYLENAIKMRKSEKKKNKKQKTPLIKFLTKAINFVYFISENLMKRIILK